LKGTSLVSRVTVRFSAGFGSFNRLFVDSCSLERPFKCSRVVSDSLVSRALEGLSLTGGITLRFSGVALDGGHTAINDRAYWFSERFSVVGDSTSAVVVIAAFNCNVFNCALVL
jgi:hypothetical protein